MSIVPERYLKDRAQLRWLEPHNVAILRPWLEEQHGADWQAHERAVRAEQERRLRPRSFHGREAA